MEERVSLEYQVFWFVRQKTTFGSAAADFEELPLRGIDRFQKSGAVLCTNELNLKSQ